MFNRFALTALTLVVVFTTTFVYESFAQKPIQGQVVSFNNLVMGGNGSVTKDEAKKLADNGSPIVFKSGSRIYFVYNEDGTFAGKKLANYAGNQKVGIMGKIKKVKGLNIIIMTMIESM